MFTGSDRTGCVLKKALGFPMIFFFAMVVLGLTGALMVGCGDTTSSASNGGMAHVSVKLSDPATCQAPNGPFAHVYVTLTDVRVHTSASAGANDAGWVDLTPSLAKAPQQIDLLGLANNQCFLGSLGDTLELQAGNYQQIRVLLADDSLIGTAAGKGLNACGAAANCVVLNDGSVHPLLLSSEAKTGIKIPSGQIANGGFNVAAGQTKDLDIDFDTCNSIVREGSGNYRLKPVLHAGEVSTTSSSINGTVVDSATGKQIDGTAVVALEQKDANGIDRVFMSTVANADGTFLFCPLPAGTYDVVIVGTGASGVVYSPTVITGVATGSALATAQLHAQLAGVAGPATLQGQVTSQNSASPAAGTAVDVQLSALETVSGNLTVTVPMAPNAGQVAVTLALATMSSNTCPAGTDCVGYTMTLPAGTPYVGAFSAGGTTLTQSLLPASYTVDGFAFVPSSGGLLNCSPSELKSTPVTPVAGATLPVSTLAFVGCQ